MATNENGLTQQEVSEKQPKMFERKSSVCSAAKDKKMLINKHSYKIYWIKDMTEKQTFKSQKGLNLQITVNNLLLFWILRNINSLSSFENITKNSAKILDESQSQWFHLYSKAPKHEK